MRICRISEKAQVKGIAEPNSSFDVDGWDTAAKITILANTVLGESYSASYSTIVHYRFFLNPSNISFPHKCVPDIFLMYVSVLRLVLKLISFLLLMNFLFIFVFKWCA